ncbi:MAG TPA: hypothetical protein VFT51_02290 [Bacillales bacterium]|nr:hypothetical protein [Bacillales bacterium]
MKGFLGLCLAVLVVYTIYYDLEYGTLPHTSKAATVETHKQQDKPKIPSRKIKAKPGQTVLSIVEKLNGSNPVSIQKVVHDFEKLNPDVEASQIQIGKTYRFPIYHKNKD